ncbi:ABC transporter permease [Bradyrhizobium canariense]|uniref:NitT/TauT family transport system permease protein n=1 Tax=Bradyrhizobium canariense TaxID=255045 RepID=A0A1H2BJ88_9BRAD|nr:ABC transporter permease [Bradyrhizobium canariense]SDT58147.1 NitT/TauT family transport system permease protein [Bradyrhizobium canariense]
MSEPHMSDLQMSDLQLQSQKSMEAAYAESRRIKHEQFKYRTGVRVAQLALVLGIVAIWQVGGGVLFDPFYLGSPKGIATVLLHDLQDVQFYRDLRITGIEMGLGYCLGAFSGIALGALFARWRFAADVFNPFFVALNSIPRIALAPLLIIWFGIDLSSKIVLSATLVFFLMFFSTLAGIRGVDEAIINVARVMGANRRQIFFKVQLPGALSWIMNGLRLSLPFALIGVIVGEFLAASSGLGYRLNMYSTSYNTNGTFAMLIVMMVAMMALNTLISWIEAKAMGSRAVSTGPGLTSA